MIAYRVELWCNGVRKVRGRKEPILCGVRWREGIVHDQIEALPTLARNMLGLAEVDGWVFDGLRHLCPKCGAGMKGCDPNV